MIDNSKNGYHVTFDQADDDFVNDGKADRHFQYNLILNLLENSESLVSFHLSFLIYELPLPASLIGFLLLHIIG